MISAQERSGRVPIALKSRIETRFIFFSFFFYFPSCYLVPPPFHSSPPVDSLPDEVIESATSSDGALAVDFIATRYNYVEI